MDSYELSEITERLDRLAKLQADTNQLLTDLLQSQWALIEALGDDVEIESQTGSLEDRDDGGITPSQTLDLP